MKPARFTTIHALVVFVLLACLDLPAQTCDSLEDPFIWLEEIESERSLEWVRKHDEATRAAFMQDADFEMIQENALKLLGSKDRIPFGEIHNGYVYNFWQDDEHVRGILRRATLEEYKKQNPAWEILLDIDQLNEAEGKSWVYKGSECLEPAHTRCLVSLSLGGSDAVYVREFDYNEKKFIEDGFSLPEAKSSVSWYDENTLVVGTDFGEGSLTSSGYPRITKLWKRGTALSEAETIMEGEVSDVGLWGSVEKGLEEDMFYLSRYTSFWTKQKWIVEGNTEPRKLPFPADADLKSYFKGRFVVYLHSDWLGFKEGTLLALKKEDLGAADIESKIQVIFTPDEKNTLREVYLMKDFLLLSVLENVVGKILYYELDTSGGADEWVSGEIKLPGAGTVSVTSSSAFDNNILLSHHGFISPSKLFYLADAKQIPQEIKALPEMFDAKNLVVKQDDVTSADGTVIPYFLVARKDLKLDGRNPTLLYGYGGFRSGQTPFYSTSIGKHWLERGGVFALANIRGGDEFGPAWHKAALLENRQRCYDDFIAVAEGLIERNITSPRHLGIMGGSNGGLLVGVAFTQRPDLFNAVVCQVPLLDMLRYTKLPPGASWIGEYGDPDDPEMRKYIEKYSPYQNVRPGVEYPEVLFITSTKDDRVHPGHARKMAAKMEMMGYTVHFYEETEGGHGAATDNIQRARRHALEYNYLMKMLSE